MIIVVVVANNVFAQQIFMEVQALYEMLCQVLSVEN